MSMGEGKFGLTSKNHQRCYLSLVTLELCEGSDKVFILSAVSM